MKQVPTIQIHKSRSDFVFPSIIFKLVAITKHSVWYQYFTRQSKLISGKVLTCVPRSRSRSQTIKPCRTQVIGAFLRQSCLGFIFGDCGRLWAAARACCLCYTYNANKALMRHKTCYADFMNKPWTTFRRFLLYFLTTCCVLCSGRGLGGDLSTSRNDVVFRLIICCSHTYSPAQYVHG